MQKAYCTFSDSKIEGVSLVQAVQKISLEHSDLLDKMSQGKFEEGIEKVLLTK